MLENLTSFIGEGIHTSLRKFCESNESQIAWNTINAMPDDEWNNVCRIVAQEILKSFDVQTRSAQLPLERQKSIQAASFEEEKCPNCHEYDCRCADYDRAQLS